MISEQAQRSIAAAAVTLLVFGGSVAAFLPPFVNRITESVLLIILLGLVIAGSLILHFVFVGIAASRLGRSALLWVVLALLFFPIASIVGLILFEWFSEEQKTAA
jgi:Na+/melibiose symporter-like transporter